MHDDIVAKWNEKISNKDTVYLLGDITMINDEDKVTQIFSRLRYKEVILIKSNHDRSKIVRSNLFSMVYDYKEISYDKNMIVLSHYPFAMWNNSHHGSFNIHGHSHGGYPISSQQMDAGVDTNNMYPYHICECIEKMKSVGKIKSSDITANVAWPKAVR